MAVDLIFDSYYGKGNIEKINDFELAIGHVFPKEYKDIVSKYNGAFIVNKNVFKFYSRLVKREVEYGSGMFLPYGYIENVTETMEIKWKHPPEGFTPGLVMFSSLGNGDALCFDYREVSSDNPPIVVWHHEGSLGEDSEISLIADNFGEFLGILYEEDDDDD